MSNHHSLNWKQQRFLIILGLPSLGIAFAYTFLTMYLPMFIERLSGAGVTGLMIGGEGLFAIFVPFLIGGWSDAIETRIGRRLPFIFFGTLLITIALLLLPLSTNSLILIGIELVIFYIAYFTYFAAYYAIFPDYIPDEQRGRSQGVQGGFRAAGMFIGLVAGGFLLNIWEPLPFLVVIALLIIVTAILYYGMRHRIHPASNNKKKMKINWLAEWDLLNQSLQIRRWFIANTLWECAITVLRVFIVLYFMRGLNFTLEDSSMALALVGIAAVFAAPIAGKLADHYGFRHVIIYSLVFFAFGLLPPLFTVNTYFVAGILPVAFSAVILMTLPFSILMGYLPKDKHHGAGAALFIFSQGIGALIGPLIAGGVVEFLKDVKFLTFAETEGYSGIFLVASAFLFASIKVSLKLFEEEPAEQKSV